MLNKVYPGRTFRIFLFAEKSLNLFHPDSNELFGALSIFLVAFVSCDNESISIDIESNLISKKWTHVKYKARDTSGFESYYYRVVFDFNADGTGVAKQAITSRSTFEPDTIETQVTWTMENNIVHLTGDTPEVFLSYNFDWKILLMNENELRVIFIYPDSDYTSYNIFKGN